MTNVVLKSKVVTYKKVNEMFQEKFRQKKRNLYPIAKIVKNHENRQQSVNAEKDKYTRRTSNTMANQTKSI